jgi:hypothetical protein
MKMVRMGTQHNAKNPFSHINDQVVNVDRPFFALYNIFWHQRTFTIFHQGKPVHPLPSICQVHESPWSSGGMTFIPRTPKVIMSTPSSIDDHFTASLGLVESRLKTA